MSNFSLNSLITSAEYFIDVDPGEGNGIPLTARDLEFDSLKEEVEFQVNTTVTQRNSSELPAILELAMNLGAVAHHIFLLVPTGRGKELDGEAIGAEQYEKILHWFYDQRERVPLQLKATCAPHYYRILRQRARQEGKRVTLDDEEGHPDSHRGRRDRPEGRREKEFGEYDWGVFILEILASFVAFAAGCLNLLFVLKE
jgi:MoaA/NifB/PqqE/SkfB family radical SAM enzyme